ncbi:uncharacterized protein FTJAE_7761 [Fusarium tjaetaba]|uniref:Amine oxidase domain-containing protein n=1 Tax=Fusarium tjaetaba TaxID=1567544 RepID=A0A8H5RF52_9HYPO|nr:uncharacterized protein FTJAE_7761 [Fusarium tjaetaba]KAF5631858.1 hypothetical protein FTJAE_7761 [Fusarium tjaetaba]
MSSSTDRFRRKRVAIVGSGSAGIGALWALNKTYHDVYVYEASDRFGGHTNTVNFKKGKFSTKVDTGFHVLNATTYPHRSFSLLANFTKFLEKINIKTTPTDLTFSLSRDRGAFEWSGSSPFSLFCQRRNLLSPRMWRMLFDIFRFNQFALDILSDDDDDIASIEVLNKATNCTCTDITIGQYLELEGYSNAFRDDYLLPLAASIWSTSPDRCSLEFPAATFVRFLWNHHLLNTIRARPQWMTIEGGSKSYVDAVMKGFPPNHLFLKTPVRHVTTESNGQVRLHLENGSSALYDHVILATHGDEAYDIIKSSASEQERSIMSSFKTSQNEVVLHSDLDMMPRRKKAWASWNYLAVSSPSSRKGNINQVSLTYNMNILQHIPRNTFGDVFVTLNPLQRPKPAQTQGRYYYSQPIYTSSAVRAQKLLKHIQNTRGISYAGAWTKYGLHEDGFSSGLEVAQEHLGAKLPFEFTDSTYSRGKVPSLSLIDHLLRLIILVIQVFVVQILERLVGSSPSPRQRLVNGNRVRFTNGKHR